MNHDDNNTNNTNNTNTNSINSGSSGIDHVDNLTMLPVGSDCFYVILNDLVIGSVQAVSHKPTLWRPVLLVGRIDLPGGTREILPGGRLSTPSQAAQEVVKLWRQLRAQPLPLELTLRAAETGELVQVYRADWERFLRYREGLERLLRSAEEDGSAVMFRDRCKREISRLLRPELVRPDVVGMDAVGMDAVDSLCL